VRLLRLTVHNFKGLRDFTLEPHGKDISVRGANATGKTTLADAFWYILFDKDSSGRKDFEILPLDSNGKRVQGVTEAEVECALAYDGDGITNGKQVLLKKVYAEKWTKKRGKTEAEFGGHETAYWIDGVPQKKGDYEAFIKGIMDEEKFKLITNARYFNEILDWKARRKVILGLGAEIRDIEVISADPTLNPLIELLAGKTIDDFRKVVEAELTKTNKELNLLPTRVDEANKNLPAAESIGAIITTDLEALRRSRAEKQSLLSQLSTSGVAEKTKALREIEGGITDLDNVWRQAMGKQISEAQAVLDKANSEIKRVETEVWAFDKEVSLAEGDIKKAQESIAQLVTQWEEATSLEWTANAVTSTCPTCGQHLPDSQIVAAQEKGLALFNLEKAEKIELIEHLGKSAQFSLTTAQGKQAKASHSKQESEKSLASTKQTRMAAEEKVRDLKVKQSQPSSDPKRHQLADQQIALKEEIEQLKGGTVNPAKDKLTTEVKELDSQIASAERAKATADQRAKGLLRIEELKAQQKALGKAFESLEFQRLLCEKFVVAKARTMTERVNSKFTLARFKLFDVQINGGISDTCEVAVNGVPYSDLNNGGRLNVGLDIIDTLSEVYGMRAPVFLDNREALSDIIPIRSQLISLWVSASDKTLRIEGGTE